MVKAIDLRTPEPDDPRSIPAALRPVIARRQGMALAGAGPLLDEGERAGRGLPSQQANKCNIMSFIQGKWRDMGPYAGDSLHLVYCTVAYHNEKGSQFAARCPDERNAGVV